MTDVRRIEPRAPRPAVLLGLVGLALTSGATACSKTSSVDSDAVEQLGFEGECAACIEENCAPEVADCNGDSACVSVAACRSRDINPTTAQLCLSDREPETTSRYGALTSCYSQACRSACGLGSDLSCLGAYDVPRASAEVGGELTLIDSATGDPLVGVELEACDLLDADCDQPRTRSVTDAQGRASLVIDASELPGGFRGRIQARGGGAYEGSLYRTTPLVRRVDLGEVPFIAADVFDEVSFLLRPGTGLLAVTVLDCWSIAASGMVVRMLPEGGEELEVIYLDAGLGFAADSTTNTGLALNLAAPPGFYTVEARDAASGGTIARTSVSVEADLATVAVLEPRPAE